jgi:hypothetical protein
VNRWIELNDWILQDQSKLSKSVIEEYELIGVTDLCEPQLIFAM